MIALVSILLPDGTCRREFIDVQAVPERGSHLRIRRSLCRVLSVVHPTLEPNPTEEWSDYLALNWGEFDLEIIAVEAENVLAETAIKQDEGIPVSFLETVAKMK